MLRLQLFGSPQIEWNGQLMTQLKSRKVEALLFYLAVEPGPHRRNQLASLLWANSPDDKALSSLRFALWNLRKFMPEIPLVADRTKVSLKRNETVWVDVHKFQKALPHLLSQPPSLSKDEAATLQRAVDLFRGDFLTGLDLPDTSFFDEWLHKQRLRFHAKTVEILTRLSHYYTTHHFLPEAINTTHHLLGLDPWQEERHQQLMLLLALSNQRRAALDHFDRYRHKLLAEMDLEPEPETVTLAERIRTGEVQPASLPTELKPTSKNSQPPLFGRHTEYRWLVDRWELAGRGEGQWLLIKGEPGVGKTRLVEEFSRHVAGQGALVLPGRCYEFSGPMTYQPIATALRQNLSLIKAFASKISDTWLAELAQLVPDILDQNLALPAPVSISQGSDRYRLFEGVAYVIQAASERQPVFMFIDDLQWADTDTLDLLGYLVRRLATRPFLLIGAYVPGETSQTHPLLTLRNTLYREGLIAELSLDRLSPTVIEQIVEETITRKIDGLPQLLYEISEGNPFILFETIMALQEQNWPAIPVAKQGPDYKDQLTVPVGVQAMVERRLANLSPESRQLLSLAAVIGNEFEVALLQVAGGISTQTMLDYLDEWLSRQLVREVSNPAPQSSPSDSLPLPSNWSFDFSHDLMRTVIYNSLSQVRRQTLHQQVGAALEKLYADEPNRVIEQLAHHYHRGNKAKKALPYLQGAAHQAKTVYAWPIALKRYRQALDHWRALYGQIGLDTPLEVCRQRWQLLLGQAEVHHTQGQLAEQQNLLLQAAQETARWGDDEDKLGVIVQQLMYRPPLDDRDRYRALAEKGIALAAPLIDGVSENICRQALGDLDLEAGRFDQALVHYELALIGVAQLKHPYEAAFCLIKIGKIYLMNNRFARALACLQEAVAYAKISSYRDLLIWSLLEIARVHLFTGNFDQAYEISREVFNLCTDIGFRLAIPLDLGLECYLHTLTNKLDEAQEKGDQAWQLAQDIGDKQIMAEVQGYLGHLHLANEEPDRALISFKQAHALSEGVSSSRMIAALSYQALSHLALEQADLALSCSNQAIDRLTERQNKVEAGQRIYLNHYQILKATEQMAQAQVVLSQAREMVLTQSTKISLDPPTPAVLEQINQRFLTDLPWNRDILTIAEMAELPPNISRF